MEFGFYRHKYSGTFFSGHGPVRTEGGGLRGRAVDGRRRRHRPRVIGQARNRPRLAGHVTADGDGGSGHHVLRMMLHPAVRWRLVRRTAERCNDTPPPRIVTPLNPRSVSTRKHVQTGKPSLEVAPTTLARTTPCNGESF